ncbi:hypothetical protein NDI85_21500 [Halomicroarcula sp. S1AR25-4]|uniref:hypothetical protein n=1 Tax=Haloarcula sp. S1AR25-4 TaxID=2950538 RepID=UPI002876B9DB|nr:hypothetical protein [Halomicroarcula sp. S1AR25-4]MDS0280365.1 hypothetical protein [Halomicroarcula sp. S1AR25-4]
MTDDTRPPATTQLQQNLVDTLGLTSLPSNAYRDPTYLEAAFDARFEVADLATAHDVSKKSIYRAMHRHDIEHTTPPKNGPARRLWNTHPDTIPGDD